MMVPGAMFANFRYGWWQSATEVWKDISGAMFENSQYRSWKEDGDPRRYIFVKWCEGPCAKCSQASKSGIPAAKLAFSLLKHPAKSMKKSSKGPKYRWVCEHRNGYGCFNPDFELDRTRGAFQHDSIEAALAAHDKAHGKHANLPSRHQADKWHVVFVECRTRG